jgi:hypothetical protein
MFKNKIKLVILNFNNDHTNSNFQQLSNELAELDFASVTQTKGNSLFSEVEDRRVQVRSCRQFGGVEKMYLWPVQ